MGQSDVMKVLNKKQWLNCKQIAELTGIGYGSVSRSVATMFERGEIVAEKISIDIDTVNMMTGCRMKYKRLINHYKLKEDEK